MAKPPAKSAAQAKVETEDLAPTEWDAQDFSIAWVSSRDPQKGLNEDGALVVDLGEQGLVALAVDGMGGMTGGREAAAITIHCVRAVLTSAERDPSASLRSLVVDGLEAANRRVTTELQGGGATAVAALVTKDSAQVIHVGDAEALLMDATGNLRFRTVPHSPVGYAQQAGVLDEVSALLHPDRHLVSNGVGLKGMHIQIGPLFPLAPTDTIAICSDGITDNLLEEEFVSTLRGGPLLESTTSLFDLCRARAYAAAAGSLDPGQLGKSDDITLVVLRRRSA